MQGPPFLIIPWERDFLECLSSIIIKETGGHLDKAVVIFMHDRPRRYLTAYFQQHPELSKPCILPYILTIQELLSCLYLEQYTSLCYEAGLLDQVDLLFSCVEQLSALDVSLFNLLSKGGAVGFFPWGLQLASVFEECFTQGLKPRDLLYTEGEVEPFGTALLASLGQIFLLYKQKLEQEGMTTPALKSYVLAEQIRQNTFNLPSFLKQKSIFLAGFSTLTGTENIIFRYLWAKGAKICLHVDSSLADRGNKGHWACSSQAKWIQSWNASTELVFQTKPVKKIWHFFAGYDLHSQLEKLQDDFPLHEDIQTSTAIVLTNSKSLLPILHHLPHKNCNISLGYPLNKSLLFRLLENIFKIRELQQEDGTIYWKSLLHLIRHPYLRFLKIDGVELYSLLHKLEQWIVNGQKYIDLNMFFIEVEYEQSHKKYDYSESEWLLLKQLIKVTVENCITIDTLAKFADFLSILCDFLLQFGYESWQRFPLDAECLFRLVHKVIPALKDNRMAHTVLSWELLQSMVVALIHDERVPFEADPITGLQVLGMLETRLLHFSKIFLIDVTDDQLPGNPIRSSLLPDSLRKILGLPNAHDRDILTAYTFYRLLAGAKEVYLYWQEGIEVSNSFEGKKQKSRFVEEILWEEEQSIGSQITPGDYVLNIAKPEVSPPLRRRRHIIKTPAIQRQLNSILSHPVSATQLDTYLMCPLRFYFERVAMVRPVEVVNEDDDPASVGQLLHKVLKVFFMDYVGKECTKEDLSSERLRMLFKEELLSSGLINSLPPESSMMLSLSGPEKLVRFLSRQPDKTKIIHLEKYFQATLQINGNTRILEGILDRVDKRGNEGVIIFDYKSGRIKNNSDKLWQNESIWSNLESFDLTSCIEHPEKADELLFTLSEKISTIQLLYYIYLYRDATGEEIQDAAFISLGEDGAEYWLMRDLAANIKEDIILNKIPRLLKFLLYHMEYRLEIRPHEGRHCTWCSWNNLCKVNG